MTELTTPLRTDQIDFRVKSINKGGYATILAYKDARVDMERLDEVVGYNNWQRRQEVINGNLYCSVGVFCGPITINEHGIKDLSKVWVWKQDVGTPSKTEGEKGEASDAFKRACFNWGIGRELYDYPVIQIKLNPHDNNGKGGEWELGNNGNAKQTWNLKLKDWSWYSEFDGKKLVFLAAKDEKGNLRFKWGERNPIYSTQQHNDFHDLIESKKTIQFAQFMSELDERIQGELCGSFKNGKISEGRKIVLGLQKEGVEHILRIKQMIDNTTPDGHEQIYADERVGEAEITIIENWQRG